MSETSDPLGIPPEKVDCFYEGVVQFYLRLINNPETMAMLKEKKQVRLIERTEEAALRQTC